MWFEGWCVPFIISVICPLEQLIEAFRLRRAGDLFWLSTFSLWMVKKSPAVGWWCRALRRTLYLVAWFPDLRRWDTKLADDPKPTGLPIRSLSRAMSSKKCPRFGQSRSTGDGLSGKRNNSLPLLSAIRKGLMLLAPRYTVFHKDSKPLGFLNAGHGIVRWYENGLIQGSGVNEGCLPVTKYCRCDLILLWPSHEWSFPRRCEPYGTRWHDGGKVDGLCCRRCWMWGRCVSGCQQGRQANVLSISAMTPLGVVCCAHSGKSHLLEWWKYRAGVLYGRALVFVGIGGADAKIRTRSC